MAVSYKKLFHLLVDRDISNNELQNMAGFSGNIMTRMKREQYISLESVEKICKVLDCKVDDILEFTSDKQKGWFFE
ncbi:XRE family transcriptional regulator [Enterococcus faecium]|nr:XRE family transcriptional regulator [Enterococcus faecium]